MRPGFRVDSTMTASFKALKPRIMAARSHMDLSNMRAVVIGGGTGAPVSIRTLLSLGVNTSAVVAMADDGGSTGILREEAHVSPPGDVRKCIAAFALDPDDPMTRAFKYRFEFARNHTLGNLMLSALEDATGSFPDAVRTCERILHCRGHVYPSTLNNVTLMGRTCDGRVIGGEESVGKTTTAIHDVWLESPERCLPYSEAIRSIREADLIVLGPGSLFTSIIPNLLVPGIVEAIRASEGKTLFVCGLADMQGETWGLSAREHVDALMRHGLEGCLDYVLLHHPGTPHAQGAVEESFENCAGGGSVEGASTDVRMGRNLNRQIRPLVVTQADIRAIQSMGPLVLVRNLADSARPTWHNPEALAHAFTGVFKLCLSHHR